MKLDAIEADYRAACARMGVNWEVFGEAARRATAKRLLGDAKVERDRLIAEQAAVVASRHTIERYLQLSDLIDAALKREDELMAICFPRSDQ